MQHPLKLAPFHRFAKLAVCLVLVACTKDAATTVSTNDASSSSGEPTTGTGNTGSTNPEVTSTTGEPTTGGPGSSTAITGSSTAITGMTGDSGDSGDETDTGMVVACDGASTNLDGVCIVFLPQQDAFSLAQAAAGVTFDYVVIVTADVQDVTQQSKDNCDWPGPSGLYVDEWVEGDDQNYCVCDEGKCFPPDDLPITLKQGEYPGSLEWDGKNWNGPSDTSNPKGPPFPPGIYTVRLRAIGQHQGQDFEVTADLPITLTPP